jgi:membrane protein DedA with SNARE-associated domain
MPAPRFAALTAAGSGIWNALFIAAGYQLGENYAVIEQWIAPVSTGVVVALAAGLVWLVVRRRRAVDGESSDVVDGDSSSKPAEPELELTSR